MHKFRLARLGATACAACVALSAGWVLLAPLPGAATTAAPAAAEPADAESTDAVANDAAAAAGDATADEAAANGEDAVEAAGDEAAAAPADETATDETGTDETGTDEAVTDKTGADEAEAAPEVQAVKQAEELPPLPPLPPELARKTDGGAATPGKEASTTPPLPPMPPQAGSDRAVEAAVTEDVIQDVKFADAPLPPLRPAGQDLPWRMRPVADRAIAGATADVLADLFANRFDEALAGQAALKDPLAKSLVEFLYVRDASSHASWRRIERFLAEHADWPSRGLIEKRLEVALFSQKASADDVIQVFSGRAPETNPGRIALAEALLAKGSKAEAKAMAAELWRRTDLTSSEEDLVDERLGSLLTKPDHRARAVRLVYTGELRDAAAPGRSPRRPGPPADQGGRKGAAGRQECDATTSTRCRNRCDRSPSPCLRRRGWRAGRARTRKPARS